MFRVIDDSGIRFVENEVELKNESSSNLFRKGFVGKHSDGANVVTSLYRSEDNVLSEVSQKPNSVFTYDFGGSVGERLLYDDDSGLIEFINGWEPGYFRVELNSKSAFIFKINVLPDGSSAYWSKFNKS